MTPITAFAGTAFFLDAIAETRYVSLDSIATATSVPPTILGLVMFRGQPSQHLLFGPFGSLLVLFSRRDDNDGVLARVGCKLEAPAGP